MDYLLVYCNVITVETLWMTSKKSPHLIVNRKTNSITLFIQEKLFGMLANHGKINDVPFPSKRIMDIFSQLSSPKVCQKVQNTDYDESICKTKQNIKKLTIPCHFIQQPYLIIYKKTLLESTLTKPDHEALLYHPRFGGIKNQFQDNAL